MHNYLVRGVFVLQDCNHDHSQDKQSHVYVNRFSDSRVLPDVNLGAAVLSWAHLKLRRSFKSIKIGFFMTVATNSAVIQETNAA